MLRKTFLHIPGIGEKTEQKIWSNEIYTWNDFLNLKHTLNMGPSKLQRIEDYVKRSIQSHKENDYQFLLSNFPNNIHWRSYNDLRDKCCFLDIETTGLDSKRNDLTVIGLYDGIESKFFIRGKNLGEFRDEIQKYDLVVTFNGKRFDVPFIQEKFVNLDFNMFHIDLMYELKKLGYSGGLKKIEKNLGIKRAENVDEVDGREAVRLWKKYVKGNDNALDTLIDYNREDIVNLKEIMEFTYDKLRDKRFSY
ncbi:MAG: ribonuclease H-like domain-containing protein [Candidatus Aenigmatarchaeota archaeon]